MTPPQPQMSASRQDHKMEAVGRLAVGIAHDFNNLLTAILGFGAIVRSGVSPDAEISRDVDEVLKAADKARRLTQQLLAFSRKQDADPSSVDANELVRGLHGLLRRLVREDIAIEIDLQDNVRSILADQVRMEQVVLNLTVNACDAMPEGGTVRITTRDAGSPGGVMFSVSDNGSGIDAETREQLFEPFFTTKEPGKGTGLGLAIVHDFVNDAGGSIAVDSAPGQGTTFTLCFPPASPRQVAPSENSDSCAIAGCGETILLVEDDGPLRMLAGRILRTAGYHVVEAADGEEALEQSRDHFGPIDLLVTDVIMPKLGGVELAARLNLSHPDMRVIYMSGYSEATMKRRTAMARDACWIGKPFSPHEFLSEIQIRLQTPRASTVMAGGPR
jgi:two-component system, cell cycle sensor histidine kinase and response regulator CckA